MVSKDSRSADAAERRKHAEEIARENDAQSPENIEAMSPEEIRRMLYALRVHQIELDMQNEELRRSQMELDASRARYFNFYDMAPDGYFTLSEKGLIQEANLTAAAFLDVDRGALVDQPFSRFIHKEDQDICYQHLKQLFKTGYPQTCELRMTKPGEAIFWGHLAFSREQDSGGAPWCHVVLSDITERKFREDERELTAHLITLINTPGDITERMSELTVSLQGWSGCEAVGIRLRAGDDYPYYETRGFPPEFVQAEKYLCARGPDGKILRDGTGNPVLECMCGNVLCGRFDFAKPFFTTHGSFWSNSTTALLASTTEADRQARTRNRCNGMGYESVALIPIRTGDQVLGLIQFNDHRPNRFTPNLIDHFERMADSLAIALSHRQTEEILQESEERFRKLFQYHSAVKLVIDPDAGDIIDANEAAAQFYGWPLEALKKMRIQQINVLPPDAGIAEMNKAELSAPARFEFKHRKADGSIRQVEVFSNKIEISGKYLLYSIIQDISERKQAEEMLNLHMAIMETVAEGIFLIGLEDNIIKWTNSKFEKLFGYGPGEMLGMHVDKVNAPTEKTPTETRLSIVDILRQTGEWHGEIKSIRKDGTHFWCYIHVSLFNHPKFGTVMVSAHTDITDRKQAEAALQESELRFRTMANAMLQLVWIARADGHVFWYNRRWYDYTGTVPEQMAGWGWRSVHDPNRLPMVLERWQASLATGEPFDMTFPLRGADGVFRPFLTRVIPLKDSAGRVMQWFGTNTDISELKRVEEQLRASLAEKEVLIKEVHHRVKNNLQIISSLVSLQVDTLADDKIQGVLGDVRGRIMAMALVHEKLYQTEDLAKLNFAEYAASLLEYIWRSHGPAADNVRLKMLLTPFILPVEIAVHCGLILNELASNIIKHAFPSGGGGEVAVILEHDPETGAVCLRVRDNGIGLPADLDWRQSTSLGLRLVQMLARQMRGTVQTGPGPGTEFQFDFNIKETPT